MYRLEGKRGKLELDETLNWESRNNKSSVNVAQMYCPMSFYKL